MTELQEINEDLRINAALITFAEEAATEEWVDAEVDALHKRIELLAGQVAETIKKHHDAPALLVELKRRKERLLKMRSVNTNAAIQKLLDLQKKVLELQSVDAS